MWPWMAIEALAQERYYLANDDHTDYFWSATGDEYAQKFQDMLGAYLDLADQTAGNPLEAQSRFVADGSLWIWEFEHGQPAAEFDRLIAGVRAGSIVFPMQSLVTLPGAMPTEAVLRDMYYAGRLERRYALDLDLVLAMENQTLPGGVASLWAGSGAKYSWRGVCGCATRIDAIDRPREIYWFEGPDGQRVLMKWNSQRTGNPSLGGVAEAADPAGALAFMAGDGSPESDQFRASWPFEVYGAFGYGGDAVDSYTEDFVDLALVDDRVIVSNEVDFFRTFEATYGAELETFRGGFGNEWELYTASLAAVTSGMRTTVEKLRTAEALATIAELFDPGFLAGREPARDLAFLQMGLFYDHWTADNPTLDNGPREQFQRDALAAVRAYVDPLYDDARAELGGLIPAAGAVRYAVFNPLTWSRSDTVALDDVPEGPVHVLDVQTGEEVPSQRMLDGRLRVAVKNVPSVGYRVVEVVTGEGTAFPNAAEQVGNTLSNAMVAVTVGTDGSITALTAKGREWVAAEGALGRLSTDVGTVEIEEQGPVSTTLRVNVSSDPPYTSRITLTAGSDVVGIAHHLSGGFGREIAADFEARLVGDVTIRHEEVGQIAEVGRAAEGGDYADQNTRTDWLTLGHFVDLSDPAGGLTISSTDGPFFQPGGSTIGVLRGDLPTVRVVVGMQVDGPGLGFVDQGGDKSFEARYAVWPHEVFDAAASMRMALEHQDPLVSTRVIGPVDAPLPTDTFSLVASNDPDVIGWAVKPQEDGIAGGVVTRWWNLAAEPRTPSFTVPYGTIGAAFQTTHVETDLGPVAVDAAGALAPTLVAEQIGTWRFLPVFADILPTNPTNPTSTEPTPDDDDDGPDFPVAEGDGGKGGCGCDGSGVPVGWGAVVLAVIRRRRTPSAG